MSPFLLRRAALNTLLFGRDPGTVTRPSSEDSAESRNQCGHLPVFLCEAFHSFETGITPVTQCGQSSASERNQELVLNQMWLCSLWRERQDGDGEWSLWTSYCDYGSLTNWRDVGYSSLRHHLPHLLVDGHLQHGHHLHLLGHPALALDRGWNAHGVDCLVHGSDLRLASISSSCEGFCNDCQVCCLIALEEI